MGVSIDNVHWQKHEQISKWRLFLVVYCYPNPPVWRSLVHGRLRTLMVCNLLLSLRQTTRKRLQVSCSSAPLCSALTSEILWMDIRSAAVWNCRPLQDRLPLVLDCSISLKLYAVFKKVNVNMSTLLSLPIKNIILFFTDCTQRLQLIL